MFRLLLQDIHPGNSAGDKIQAIHDVASALVKAGYVEEGYVNGMLNREQQASTYLGNGIAIPHGTLETRDLVKKTGVQVFQFPQGIAWGDEAQLAYVAIGIAAKSDEHLTLLRQLTGVLSQDGIEAKLAAATTAEELCLLLTGKGDKSEILFDNTLISLGVKTDSLPVLQAINAGLLQKAEAVDNSFIAGVMNSPAVHLGQGVWLSDSSHGNLQNAIAVGKPETAFYEKGEPVKLLITVSVVDDEIDAVLKKLATLLSEHKTDELLNSDPARLIALFSQAKNAGEQDNSAEFVVVNRHGLHTRPGSLLVKVIKSFKSTITVANLDGTGKPVSASSLMKVVALGAKQGDRLRFTATGGDAQEALEAIGKAIADGLGEGK